ncbi:hypothetical protein [Streptomyces sp. NBC_01304]|uniref:hypothetical protein n=1 Tax=Streptomyces sp. NBC_01304 TaxID=2903818 RepID=UPI002E15DB24|nr:hypothetical protein OG430_44975 [Streptomyces sp. NBC_01304]
MNDKPPSPKDRSAQVLKDWRDETGVCPALGRGPTLTAVALAVKSWADGKGGRHVETAYGNLPRAKASARTVARDIDELTERGWLVELRAPRKGAGAAYGDWALRVDHVHEMHAETGEQVCIEPSPALLAQREAERKRIATRRDDLEANRQRRRSESALPPIKPATPPIQTGNAADYESALPPIRSAMPPVKSAMPPMNSYSHPPQVLPYSLLQESSTGSAPAPLPTVATTGPFGAASPTAPCATSPGAPPDPAPGLHVPVAELIGGERDDLMPEQQPQDARAHVSAWTPAKRVKLPFVVAQSRKEAS